MKQLFLVSCGFVLAAVGIACSSEAIDQEVIAGTLEHNFGAIGAAFTLPTGSEPVAVTVGDFDKDEDVDFATANFGSGTASIYRNNGDDTFTKSQELNVGDQPTGIASGNLDKDGTDYVDLVLTVLEGPGYVESYLGKNNGTFVPKTGRSVSNKPRQITAGELDEDKWDDIIILKPGMSPPAVGARNNTKSDGGFKDPKNLQVKAGPVDVAIHRIDGNNYDDFGVVNRDADSVSVYLRLDKDGNTYSAQKVTSLPAGSKPTSIAFGDLNRDGKADAVVTNGAKSTVSILLGKGDGTFTAQDAMPAVGDRPIAVDIADLNRDGHLDAIVANQGSGTVSVLMGKGDGTFHAQRIVTVGSKPSDVRVEQFGESASLDIVVTNRGDNTVSIILF